MSCPECGYDSISVSVSDDFFQCPECGETGDFDNIDFLTGGSSSDDEDNPIKIKIPQAPGFKVIPKNEMNEMKMELNNINCQLKKNETKSVDNNSHERLSLDFEFKKPELEPEKQLLNAHGPQVLAISTSISTLIPVKTPIYTFKPTQAHTFECECDKCIQEALRDLHIKCKSNKINLEIHDDIMK